MEKVYLLMGASSELGMRMIGKLNNECNGNVIIHAWYRTMTEEFRSLCEGCNDNPNLTVILRQLDLADSRAVEAAIEDYRNQGICPTHIAHFAASGFEYMKIKKWNEEVARRDMDIAYFSFARVCSEFLPMMAKKGYGRVVAVLSSYTLGTPPKFMSNYVAAKSALWGYIKGAAIEYADCGLCINGISPGMMETKFLSNLSSKIIEMNAATAVSKHNMDIDSTVDAILYLLSDSAKNINGINMNLSCGDYM